MKLSRSFGFQKLGSVFGLCLLAATLLSSCARHTKITERTFSNPIIRSLRTENLATKASASPESATSPSVHVVITADKNALLSQDFFYGSDLQYSSLYDKDSDLYNQSMAIGHIPARFRIAGDELQLVSDNRQNFPSDVNHPERLLSRFKILFQTETTLTLSGADSSLLLARLASTAAGIPYVAPQDHWIRSFEFDPNGNYLLQQSSVVLANGTIGEFMEAIFPRQSLAPSSRFQKIKMDPDSPVGAEEGPAARYRLLAGDKIFEDGKPVAYAQHFDLPENQTIDWYVTRNIPDEYLEPVGLAIEAWNRYFRAYKGIERNAVRFRGRLPENIHLGDPRYNVVNWDSRRVAGAAFETQAGDPFTGKQSHSLIYLPAAWLQIGIDYWKKGQGSESSDSISDTKARTFRIACNRDLRSVPALIFSGRLMSEAPNTDLPAALEKFGRELLKQTLFHEVGHAMGLAHDFKGSLSFDRADPKTPATHSVMDYNDFEVERAVFSRVDSADGPLLEYDRQAMSALYNQSKDVLETDPVLPACDDAEADSEEGGVDPLCVRYDIEKDPTHSVVTAFNRIAQSTLPGDVTLAQALHKMPGIVLSSGKVASVTTLAELQAQAKGVADALKGTLSFYILSGKASLNGALKANLKTLFQYSDDALPAGYDAEKMRDQVFVGIQRALSFTQLNSAIQQALEEAAQAAIETLEKSPYCTALPSKDRSDTLSSIRDKILSGAKAFITEATGLPSLRTKVLSLLNRHPHVPYFFGKKADGSALDYEALIVQLLADAIPADGARTDSERLAAAKSLASYSKRLQGASAISRVITKLNLERSQASDNASRELIEKLITALSDEHKED